MKNLEEWNTLDAATNVSDTQRTTPREQGRGSSTHVSGLGLPHFANGKRQLGQCRVAHEVARLAAMENVHHLAWSTTRG